MLRMLFNVKTPGVTTTVSWLGFRMMGRDKPSLTPELGVTIYNSQFLVKTFFVENINSD